MHQFKQTLLNKGVADISKEENLLDEEDLSDDENLYTKFYHHLQENPEVGERLRGLLKEVFKPHDID